MPETTDIDSLHEAMAAKGDVEGLLDVLSNTHWSGLNMERMFRLLMRSIDVAIKADPARFAELVTGRLAGFIAYMVLRAHLVVARAFTAHDATERGSSASRFLPHDVEAELPNLLELEHHAAEILEMQARTARLWRLTQREPIAPARQNGANAGTNQKASANGDGTDGHHAPDGNGTSMTNRFAKAVGEHGNGRNHHGS